MTPLARASRWLPVLAWMGVLAYWSGQPHLPIDIAPVNDVFQGWQHKLAHLAAFGLLALLAGWASDGLPGAALLGWIVASAYGGVDEWHQSFTPGRHAGVDDWAFDTLVAGLATVGWPRLLELQPRLTRLAPVVVAACFALAAILMPVGGL